MKDINECTVIFGKYIFFYGLDCQLFPRTAAVRYIALFDLSMESHLAAAVPKHKDLIFSVFRGHIGLCGLIKMSDLH